MYDVHAKTAPKSLLDKFEKISTQHHYKSLCLLSAFPHRLAPSLFLCVCAFDHEKC